MLPLVGSGFRHARNLAIHEPHAWTLWQLTHCCHWAKCPARPQWTRERVFDWRALSAARGTQGQRQNETRSCHSHHEVTKSCCGLQQLVSAKGQLFHPLPVASMSCTLKTGFCSGCVQLAARASSQLHAIYLPATCKVRVLKIRRGLMYPLKHVLLQCDGVHSAAAKPKQE